MAQRDFTYIKGVRYVMAATSRLHMYHPECAPEGAVEGYARTRGTCCAACLEPLFKKVGVSK